MMLFSIFLFLFFVFYFANKHLDNLTYEPLTNVDWIYFKRSACRHTERALFRLYKAVWLHRKKQQQKKNKKKNINKNFFYFKF